MSTKTQSADEIAEKTVFIRKNLYWFCIGILSSFPDRFLLFDVAMHICLLYYAITFQKEFFFKLVGGHFCACYKVIRASASIPKHVRNKFLKTTESTEDIKNELI